MPGTIQVSILGLVGLPSSLQSSSLSIKVSVGKQTYETMDKGDISFPLASLRDNLNVWIYDFEGNDIAHTVVETRSIVEKGVWDDLFALNSGGHVRMKLHFNLTEHELNRIRSMRESASRKKQEDILRRSRSGSDLTVASGALFLLKIHQRLFVKLKTEELHLQIPKLPSHLLLLMLKFALKLVMTGRNKHCLHHFQLVH